MRVDVSDQSFHAMIEYIMVILKKLIFAPIFLLVFALLIYQLSPILKSYDFIFSLSITTLIDLIGISALILFSSFLFALFATIASDLSLILLVAIIASAVPFIFIPQPLVLVFVVAIFVGLLLTSLSLDNALKTYLTFRSEVILGPAIRLLSTLFILSFCIIYFLQINKTIAKDGFQIPDSLIETALKVASPNLPAVTESPDLPRASIPAEQLELLKKNPDLLRQAGLDPKILDTLNQPKSQKAPQNLTQDLIKQTVKDQIQNFLKPYINFVPAALAILLFLTLQSLTSIINLLIYPLLWIIFFILEATGFIKFEIEQRPVKKLVV